MITIKYWKSIKQYIQKYIFSFYYYYLILFNELILFNTKNTRTKNDSSEDVLNEPKDINSDK